MGNGNSGCVDPNPYSGFWNSCLGITVSLIKWIGMTESLIDVLCDMVYSP